jgi:hypothetical protein
MTIKHLAALAAASVVLAGTGVIVPTAAQAEPYPCYDCVAPTMVGGGSSGSQTAAFVGLQWNFGAATPEITAGVRYLTSGDNGFVYGAQADAALPLMGDQFGPTIRLLGLAGNADVQAQAGVGYDFAAALPLIAVGAQTQYFTAGANIELGGSVNPYFGLNTLTKPTLTADGVLSCADQYHTLRSVDSNGLVDGTSESADPSEVLNGQTCYQPV